MSMDGRRSDQKLAAIITPAANPIMTSRSRRFTLRVRKTTEAPKAVTNQVKDPASRDCNRGDKPPNQVVTTSIRFDEASAKNVDV
jgi:hypothetical protein